MTVKNTLDFANKCLNDSNIDELNEIISILGLDDCKNNIIGNEFLKGCSGGEIKRTSIAESILSPAKILLMDKITTGLDSSTAYNICKMLVRRTKVCEGILVCTLLQPSPDIISLFDNVILMNDGEIKYFGKTKNIISIFENKKLLINDNNFNEIYDVIDSYKLENNCKEINDCSDKEENDVKKNDNMKKNKLYEKNYQMSFLKELFYLISIQLKLLFNDIPFVISKIVQSIVIGLIFGWIYYDIDIKDCISRYGVIVSTIITIIDFAFPLLISVFYQKRVLYKQLQNNYYRVPSYVLSVIFSEYIIQFIEIIIFGSIVYFMSNMSLSDNGIHYFIWIAYLFIGYITFTSLLLIFIYLCNSIEIFSAITPVICFLLNSFNGYNITRNAIPKWLIEFHYISPISYMIKGSVLNEFTSSKYSNYQSEICLDLFDFPKNKNEQIIYFIIIICENIFFIILQIIVLYYVRYDPFKRNEIKKQNKKAE